MAEVRPGQGGGPAAGGGPTVGCGSSSGGGPSASAGSSAGGGSDAGPGEWRPFRSLWDYARPRESLRPPIWRERRRPAEEAALATDRPPPPPAPDGAPPVLVVPGFGAPDDRVALLRDWLAEGGWDVHATGGVPRKRCGSVEVVDLTDRVRRVRSRTGRRVMIVGHSRGGQLAKAIAVRDPDLVAGVVAVGSPLTDPFGTHLSIRLLTTWLSVLSRAGAGDYVRQCATGTCCQEYHDAVIGRVPDDLPLWSVLSPSDGLILPAAARDPQAVVVEVDSSHTGLPVNPRVWRAVARALADPRVVARTTPDRATPARTTPDRAARPRAARPRDGCRNDQ